MSYIRIKMIDDRTYLVYNRLDIFAMSALSHLGSCSWRTKLEEAYMLLKLEIRSIRMDRIKTDRLAEKNTGSILTLLRHKRAALAGVAFESKKPTTKDKHVGVEIEFISHSDRDDIARDLAALDLAKYVELKRDGSVHDDSDSNGGDCDGSCREDCTCAECGDTHYCDDSQECNRRARNYGSDEWEFNSDCDECTETETIDDCDCGGLDDDGEKVCKGEHIVCEGHCPGHSCLGSEDHNDYDCNCDCDCESKSGGHEIAIVAKSSKIAEVLTKVCEVLAKHNSKVNSSCGLHVHVDMRGRDQKRAFANLVKSQRLLYSMCPKSRYNNSYCAPNEHGLDMGGYEGRYWGINPKSYEEHRTIEVRLHSGSINAEKIINWVVLLQKIAYAKSMDQVDYLSDLIGHVKLSKKLVKYIKDRVGKFADEHGDYSVQLENPQLELAA